MRESYKKAMSGVRPSAQCTERILNMPKENRKHLKKGWIIAVAAAAILLCALFTANAATDGALFNGTLFQDLRVILDGKEYRLNDYLSSKETITYEDGYALEHYSYDLPDGMSIDAFAGEEYTAFAVDANDADSIQIVGGDDNADNTASAENDQAMTTDGDVN